MTDEERALELYHLAVSLMEAKGRFVTVGLVTYKEYRGEGLGIRYFPSSGHMDVWRKRKLLMIDRRQGKLQVSHYVPGPWEQELEKAATEKSP